MAEAQANLGGRPTKFQPWMMRVAAGCYELGATDEQLADILDVSRQSIENWCTTIPGFIDTKKCKDLPDSEIEASLHKRAKGYTLEDGTHIPAHPVAQIFWLKNRKPGKWRDKQEIEASVQVAEADPMQVAQKLVTLATQHPTMNPVIRKWLQDTMDKLPEIET